MEETEKIERDLEQILEGAFPEIDFEDHDKARPFRDQISFDSLGLMAVIVEVKKRLKVTISPQQIKNLYTFQDLMNFIIEKKQ